MPRAADPQKSGYWVGARIGQPGVQNTVTGGDCQVDLQLLSQSGRKSNCLSRSVLEIHFAKTQTNGTSRLVSFPLASCSTPCSTATFLLRSAVCGTALVGLMVKASTSRAEDPWFESSLCRDFFWGRVDLKIGTPVATLPGTWRYRVSAGTGWLGVSIL